MTKKLTKDEIQIHRERIKKFSNKIKEDLNKINDLLELKYVEEDKS